MKVYYFYDFKENMSKSQKNISEHNIVKAAFKFLKVNKIKNVSMITYHRRYFFDKLKKIFGLDFVEALCKRANYKYKNNHVELVNENVAPHFNSDHILAYFLDFESLEKLVMAFPEKVFLWIPSNVFQVNEFLKKYEAINIFSNLL
jgi:hypothetical protein